MPNAAPAPVTRLPRLRAQVEATALARLVYEATQRFPPDEQARLGDQMRRAALSVPANIAEGCSRASQADRARLLGIAWGSLRELEAHLELAAAVALVDAETAAELAKHCRWAGRLLYSLLQSRAR